MTILTLRFPWFPTTDELVENYVQTDRSMVVLRDDDAWSGKQVLFSYLHINDACTIARRAVEADYTGHETFWGVADDTTAAEPTEDVVAEFLPDVEVRETLDGYETLFDLSKAEELLGWTPEHSWRDF